MAGCGKLYGASNMTLFLQNERLPSSSEVLDSLWAHTSNPTFPGSKPLVNFESVSGSTVRDRPFLQALEREENGDEDYEACFHQPGKKRRLTSEQVQFLEKKFEVENKLEPERKVQLAKELGLQPRQVAIWFQNRRARFKTKQLEKDYGALKACYDKLKTDHDNLAKENDKLKEEVNSLKNRLIAREKEKEESHKSQGNDPEEAGAESSGGEEEGGGAKEGLAAMGIMCKQEDANSARSDVLDSEDTEANHQSSMVEPADSSQALEPEHSNSQDEEDNLSRSMLGLPCFPKVEQEGCYEEPPVGSCSNFAFPLEDHTFCFWPY